MPRRSAALAVARARRLPSLAEHEHGLDVGALDAPQRHVGCDVQHQEQPQLELAADQRGKLEQERARAGGSVQVEAGRGHRLLAHLGEGLHREGGVVALEPALGRARDDDARDVRARREPVGGVVPPGAVERDDRPAMSRLEERLQSRAGLRQKRAVRRLEALRPARLRGGGARGRSVLALAPLARRRRDRHGQRRTVVDGFMGHAPRLPRMSRDLPSFTDAATSLHGSTRLHGLALERVLDGGDDAVGVVPLLVDAHSLR